MCVVQKAVYTEKPQTKGVKSMFKTEMDVIRKVWSFYRPGWDKVVSNST